GGGVRGGQGVRVAATAGPDAHGPRPGGDAAAVRSVRAGVSEAPGQAEGEGGPLSEYSADRGRERLAEVGGGDGRARPVRVRSGAFGAGVPRPSHRGGGAAGRPGGG